MRVNIYINLLALHMRPLQFFTMHMLRKCCWRSGVQNDEDSCPPPVTSLRRGAPVLRCIKKENEQTRPRPLVRSTDINSARLSVVPDSDNISVI
uniref:Uncharacterized protein n=1 Tax=viral metagenome TaxID=1070528 RepID=A0A6C0C000_9ZZZZ